MPFLVLGEGITPDLQSWREHPEFHHEVTERVLITDGQGHGALRTHAVVPEGGINWGSADGATAPGNGQAVGSYHYGEIQSTGSGIAWGANLIGATYSPTGHAIGTEINGINRSGSESNIVYGGIAVMVGNAPTDAGFVVETSLAEPEGQADYGFWLKSTETVGARKSGVRIDKTESGEAFQTLAGQRIALTQDGQVYLKFDPETGKVNVWKYGVLVASW